MAQAWGSVVVKVLAAFDADPKATSADIAKRLDLSDGYVRTALRRNGRVLKRSPDRRKRSAANTIEEIQKHDR